MWFRKGLRLDDNPALSAAVKTGLPVFPFFILDPFFLADPAKVPCAASRGFHRREARVPFAGVESPNGGCKRQNTV